METYYLETVSHQLEIYFKDGKTFFKIDKENMDSDIETLWDMIVDSLANDVINKDNPGLVRRQREANAALMQRLEIVDEYRRERVE